MPRKSKGKRLGLGATCALLLKFLHPSDKLAEKFPNVRGGGRAAAVRDGRHAAAVHGEGWGARGGSWAAAMRGGYTLQPYAAEDGAAAAEVGRRPCAEVGPVRPCAAEVGPARREVGLAAAISGGGQAVALRGAAEVGRRLYAAADTPQAAVREISPVRCAAEIGSEVMRPRPYAAEVGPYAEVAGRGRTRRLLLLNPKLGDFFTGSGYGRSYLGQKRGRFAVSIVNLCRYRIGLIISATRDLPA